MATTDVQAVDSTLVQTAAQLDFLLAVTPTNSTEAFTAFEKSGFKQEPVFDYREAALDRASTIAALNALPVDDIEDATVRTLFSGKRMELISQIQMIDAIGTKHFRDLSVEVYGDIDDDLFDAAEAVLSELPRRSPTDPRITPDEMARRAQDELARYCDAHPDLKCEVQIRDDVVDLMVSRGNFFIGSASLFRSERVDALIEHEIGTHVVTFHNGSRQPYLILCVGLAGYEETQEGLALLAEHLVDGLDIERMRVLAARVIAVRRMLEGESFVEIFCELRDRLGFTEHTSWGITARIARAGGFTKDAIYLRGLKKVIEYLRDGGSFEPLLVGKIALEQAAAIEDLLAREILVPGVLEPHWLQTPDIEQRLDRVRRLEGPIGLVTSEMSL